MVINDPGVEKKDSLWIVSISLREKLKISSFVIRIDD
jgi:hypothetical protein